MQTTFPRLQNWHLALLIGVMVGWMSNAAHAQDSQDVLVHVSNMEKAAREIQDSTYVLYIQTWDGDRLSVVEQVAVKYRRPNDVFLRWTGAIHAGRQVVYMPSSGETKMWVKTGTNLPGVAVDPKGPIAQRASRHSVDEVGLVAAVDVITDDVNRATSSAREKSHFTDLGRKEIHGTVTTCWSADLPKDDDPNFYAQRVEICQDVDTNLPVRLTVWDDFGEGLRLVERFVFMDVQTNVGLTDADFDPRML